MRSGFRVLLAGAAMVFVAACTQQSQQQTVTAPKPVTPTPVERGEYLVSTLACHDCHTPTKMGPNGPEPDLSRQLSGHPESVKVSAPPKMTPGWMAAVNETFTMWSGPWGISFTANLTPDPSGLSVWTEDMFIKAIREGKHMGQSRPILPPMPWSVYRNLSDSDLKAIFTYLKTIPPVSNHVPDPIAPEDVAKIK